MPDNYKALKEFHEYAYAMLCREHKIDMDAVAVFEDSFERAKKEHPTLFAPDEVAGTNIRAPHFKEWTTAERMKNFMALELGVSIEQYEQALKDQA